MEVFVQTPDVHKKRVLFYRPPGNVKITSGKQLLETSLGFPEPNSYYFISKEVSYAKLINPQWYFIALFNHLKPNFLLTLTLNRSVS